MAYKALLIEGHPTGLRFVSDDIKLMKRTFEHLDIDSIEFKGNSQAVQSKIEELSTQAFANDILILYFTGHGELKRKKLYLKVENENNFYSDMLSLSIITEILDNSNFSKILFVLDCCNASAVITEAITTLDEERFLCMYSSRKLEESKELTEYKSSAFTHFFTTAVSNLISNFHQQPITLRDLEEETNRLIKGYNNAHKRANIPLTGAYYAKSGEFVLYENFQSSLSILSHKKFEYFQNFKYCTDNCDKSCYDKFFWCNTIFRYSIDLTKYAVPTVNTNDGQKVKLNVFFKNWIEAKNAYLALLGDVGVGKSSSCFYLFSLISNASVTTNAVPIFIPLYLWQERIKYNESIIDAIAYFSNGFFTKSEISELIKSKDLVILLDGFDEISNDSTISSILHNFQRLTPFLRLKCKTLLTCRTHYFSEQNQIADVLEGKTKGTDFAAILLNDEYKFLVAELQEFSEDEILEVISYSMPEENANDVWDEIKQLYDLRDLAKRAIILKMILRTLPELKAQSSTRKITSSLLYKTYTTKLLKREQQERRYIVDLSECDKFIEYIASLMWKYRTLRINTNDFKSQIRGFYSENIIDTEALNQYTYHSRVSSFFVRDKKDNYTFSHKSFYEYYLARNCINEIVDNKTLLVWNIKWFDKEIATFIKDIIQTDDKKLAIYNLFRIVQETTLPIIIWNTLHILSLLDIDDVAEFLTDSTKQKLINKAQRETNCVIIRQYCRVIAKFIDRSLAEILIDKIIDMVNQDNGQNIENNETYYNYYGGKEAACNAFIEHLCAPMPKYDALLHIYLLGDIAEKKYILLLQSAVNNWKLEVISSKILEAVNTSIETMSTREVAC